MNRVTRRAGITLVFILALVVGISFFLWEYFTQAEDWVMFSTSPHTSASGGTVCDREGVQLLDTTDGRTYSGNAEIRKATLHWIGDRSGNISTRVVSNYTLEMSGFNTLDGLYTYGEPERTATLTLSSTVQCAALEAMAGRKGTVAVYNYRTGEILCALSTPTFDPDQVPDIGGDTTGAYDGVYVNRFAHSVYIPGSIFKIVTTAAALESVPGIETMTFTCTGTVEYGTDRVTCEKAHGTLDLKGALAHSCNCAFAQISQLVGGENMTRYVEQFGITKSQTFDGIVTASGNYQVENAAPVELAWSCIGQYTDQINPCRYMTFLGAIAGDGTAAAPYLVSQIQVGDTLTYEAETCMEETVMSKSLARILREYLRNNVVSVYGDDRFAGLQVCAKSGTSQLGGGQISNAMFAGFVADDAYPLAFLVAVENGGYGASTCIPILSQVLSTCKTVMDAET